MTHTVTPQLKLSRHSGQPARSSTSHHPGDDSYRCDIAAQAIMRGNQDITVTAVAACASGTGRGHIAIRVGRVLLYLESRDALNSWRDAVGRATELADHAYGPLWRSATSDTAARIRRDGGTPTP